MPNSPHNWLSGFSAGDAATTNFTRCSCTSIAFHAIDWATPALASLAQECKGSPGTMCKGCHETEHFETWGTHAFRRAVRSGPRIIKGRPFRVSCGCCAEAVNLSHKRGTPR